MNFLSFLMLVTLTFNAFSEELSSWGQLLKRGNTYYKKSDNKPFSGVLKNFFPSGEISVIDHFKDGKQHGMFKSFHENGNLSMIGQFHEGKQVGDWSEYYDNGSLYWKLKYNNGKKVDGLFQMFHKK